MAAWKSMDQLREPDRLKQWLSGIVRNLAMNRFRQSSRDVLGQAGAVDHDLQDQKFCDPADQSLAREEFELIDRMLHALPSHYREPLVLFYREQNQWLVWPNCSIFRPTQSNNDCLADAICCVLRSKPFLNKACSARHRKLIHDGCPRRTAGALHIGKDSHSLSLARKGYRQ